MSDHSVHIAKWMHLNKWRSGTCSSVLTKWPLGVSFGKVSRIRAKCAKILIFLKCHWVLALTSSLYIDVYNEYCMEYMWIQTMNLLYHEVISHNKRTNNDISKAYRAYLLLMGSHMLETDIDYVGCGIPQGWNQPNMIHITSVVHFWLDIILWKGKLVWQTTNVLYLCIGREA